MTEPEPTDIRSAHAARRGRPCPNEGCVHDLAQHCRHAGGSWHCTNGCPCGGPCGAARSETASAEPVDGSAYGRGEWLRAQARVTHLEPRRRG